MDTNYFVHRAEGTLVYGENWWVRVLDIDRGIIDYYAWLTKRYGLPVMKSRPHITVVRGEEPPNKDVWGRYAGPITFWYSQNVRTDNGFHAWLDIWSEELFKLREELGLPSRPHRELNGILVPRGWHLTLGRLI